MSSVVVVGRVVNAHHDASDNVSDAHAHGAHEMIIVVLKAASGGFNREGPALNAAAFLPREDDKR